jgi:hypothetical protein
MIFVCLMSYMIGNFSESKPRLELPVMRTTCTVVSGLALNWAGTRFTGDFNACSYEGRP